MDRNVKGNLIGEHAKPPGRKDFGGPLVPGRYAYLEDLQLCRRVCPDSRYVVNTFLSLAEETVIARRLVAISARHTVMHARSTFRRCRQAVARNYPTPRAPAFSL